MGVATDIFFSAALARYYYAQNSDFSHDLPLGNVVGNLATIS